MGTRSYLTLEELAEYANLSVRSLRKFLALPPSQALPAYRPGRKVLVRRDEFDAWFAQYRTHGGPAPYRRPQVPAG
jgi:excisionase family DNA binding protein